MPDEHKSTINVSGTGNLATLDMPVGILADSSAPCWIYLCQPSQISPWEELRSVCQMKVNYNHVPWTQLSFSHCHYLGGACDLFWSMDYSWKRHASLLG
jgi:hypothetical protein